MYATPDIKTFSELCLNMELRCDEAPNSFPGGNSEREPPDPIPNSEVKTLSADGSVGSPHVRVGHRQDLIRESRIQLGTAFSFVGETPRLFLLVWGPRCARVRPLAGRLSTPIPCLTKDRRAIALGEALSM